VNVITPIEACSQPPKLVQQCQRLFDNVPEDAKSASMRHVASRDQGWNGATGQLHPVGIGVVPPITHHHLWFAQWRADFAADRRDGV